MSLAIVKKVRAKYPTPLGSQHAKFLIELAQNIPGSGLLKKDSGTKIRLPKPYNVDVAQDIICLFAGSVLQHYDVLKDGEGVAKPLWNLVGPIAPSRFLKIEPSTPVPSPPPPAPIPTPQPNPPEVTLDDVMTYLGGMRLEMASQHNTVMDALARLEADNRKSRSVTGSAGWIGAITGEISGVKS